ncbi:hypothetical protein [Salipiger mangrovisoli]|uniref:Uncharacterized protein n=1 Tax=Salipiger mangrovisoli TaxID=2865933 RepID=A0ABR9WWT0_9RHOB|nr:hypothetical protein [Salipiger mangrovisoli]MBE9635742.1 hypothetical protein [Salipiger mangrovisoli]
MEIPRDLAGFARPSRPRPAPGRAAAGGEPGAEAPPRPLPPPVPVTTQTLPLALLSQVTPRARPLGLVAAEGYGAALGIVRDGAAADEAD